MTKTPGADNATRRGRAPIWPTDGVSPSAQFLSVGFLGLLGVVALGGLLVDGVAERGIIVAAAFYTLALWLALAGLRKGYPHPAIGLCNVVTIARLMLTSVLIAGLFDPDVAPWSVFGVATLALMLDGVDGWLARREGYVSDFGASFDVEVDSVLALVLALHAFLGGSVGAYVILLGLPRYLFWIAQFPFPWLKAELPPRFSRKVVCVLQISALIAVLLPVIQSPLSDALVGVVALALIWSFWSDVRWLARTRA
ncbi:MAG: CDP-alcohol phosphatidyltransferase family protein [Pseudomonadota bacterium]